MRCVESRAVRASASGRLRDGDRAARHIKLPGAPANECRSLSRRALALGLAAAASGALLPAATKAGDPVVVGALRFTSSGPVFIGRDRGYFYAEGLDVDLRYFEAAP